jgi:hypothetical protein
MAEQTDATVTTPTPTASPEDRLAAYFGGGESAATTADEPPQPTADAAPTEVSADQPPETGADDQPAEDTEPFEELTHLNKTYEVPASLKKAFEENRAMATRAAETAKHASSLLEHAKAQAQLAEAESRFNEWAATEIGEKQRLEALLGQYKKLDWYNMAPDQYQEHRRNRDIIAEQLDDAKKSVDAKRSQYDNWRKAQSDELIAKGQEYLSKVIPNFAAEDTRTLIAKQGVSLGYSPQELSDNKDTRLIVALHKAAQWDKLQASKQATTNKVSKAAPVVKPGASVATNNAAVAKEKALRARLKQSGNVNDAAALLLQRMR